MSKQAKPRAESGTQAKVVVHSIRTSPRKLNLVAGLICGMHVNDALVQLTFSSRRIAVDVKKALQSVIANAENNHQLDVDSLIVKEAYVGKGLVMKRMHTRGRGKSARVLKPFSNLTIVVEQQEAA